MIRVSLYMSSEFCVLWLYFLKYTLTAESELRLELETAAKGPAVELEVSTLQAQTPPSKSSSNKPYYALLAGRGPGGNVRH